MNARWLARVAASAAVRRIVYLAIAGLIALLLSFVPTGKAQAQDYSACFSDVDTSYPCPTRQDAYEQAYRVASMKNTHGADVGMPEPSCQTGLRTRLCEYRGASGNRSVIRTWPVSECPVGSVWDEELEECAPEQCANAIPIEGRATNNSLPICSGGCTYVPDYQSSPPPGETATLQQVALGTYESAGTWKPTGGGCAVPNEGQPWDKNKPTCYSHPGASFSECVRPDGTHCVTSSTGKQYCWKIGEEGPKRTADGSEGADRRKAPATNEPPESMKDPTQTGTNQGGTTINGNVYNTSTYSGTPGEAGQADTGVPGDADGDGEVGPGEGEGEENTSAGGGSCDSPPVSTGDAILAQIALQTWEARCGNDQPGWTKGEGPDVGEPDGGDPADQMEFDIPISTDLLDQENIFGSGSCPTFEIPVPLGEAVISTSEFPWWCQAVSIMRALILLWGAYTAIRVLQGGVV